MTVSIFYFRVNYSIKPYDGEGKGQVTPRVRSVWSPYQISSNHTPILPCQGHLQTEVSTCALHLKVNSYER